MSYCCGIWVILIYNTLVTEQCSSAVAKEHAAWLSLWVYPPSLNLASDLLSQRWNTGSRKKAKSEWVEQGVRQHGFPNWELFVSITSLKHSLSLLQQQLFSLPREDENQQGFQARLHRINFSMRKAWMPLLTVISTKDRNTNKGTAVPL